MNNQTKISVGSVESSDIMMTYTFDANQALSIEINSTFFAQYGAEIKKLVTDNCQAAGLTTGMLLINDQGAIPPVIKARLTTLIHRIQNQK